MNHGNGAKAPCWRRAARLAVIAAWVCVSAAAADAQTKSIQLEWDPSPSPNLVGYRVYVGSEPGVYSDSIDIPNQTTYTFTRARRGVQYYFAVAARDASGAISAVSNEVSGIAPSTAPIREHISGPSGTASPADHLAASPVRAEGAAASDCVRQDCTDEVVVAQGSGHVTAVAALPRGRVMYIENGHRVVILDEPGGIPTTALEADAGVELQAFALDPKFAQTGLVFVAMTVLRNDGRTDLRIVRYREAGGALIDPSIRITGLPAARTAVSTSVDAEGNMFLALPSSAQSDGRRDPYAGQLLAFSADGGTRQENGPSAPVVVRAGRQPTALVWDDAARRLWMTTRDRNSLTRVDLPAGQPWGATDLQLPFRPASIAIGRDGDAKTVVLVSETGALYGGVLDRNGQLGALAEIRVTQAGHAVGVAVGEQQDVYVALETGNRWAIVRVD